eukprot:2149707-Pleurochrysis_carterae.AAC.5
MRTAETKGTPPYELAARRALVAAWRGRKGPPRAGASTRGVKLGYLPDIGGHELRQASQQPNSSHRAQAFCSGARLGSCYPLILSPSKRASALIRFGFKMAIW